MPMIPLPAKIACISWLTFCLAPSFVREWVARQI
jgi:hypothetical protein